MIGAMLRGKTPAYWKHVGNLLRHADLATIKAQFPDYPHTDLLRAIQVSVDALEQVDPKARERYSALAVLLEDMPIPSVIQQTLWGADELEALETAEQFVSLSLAQCAAQRDDAQRDGDDGSIRLHDLQLDYVRKQYPDQAALDLIRGGVRLSSHVIDRDPGEFASQLVGRLLPYIQPEKPVLAVQEFASSMVRGAPRPWLRPLRPALSPPGTALVRTLAGHLSGIYGVAVSADGRRAVSASWDKTLKVWDLESGRELRTLAGDLSGIYGVAVSADGQRAVSASGCGTLKVWDLESGRCLRTLGGHSVWVNSVAVSADGRQALSASSESTLTLWDLQSGREMGTMAGHPDRVLGLALSADGRRAVSASRDSTLKVWDLERRCELVTLKGHSAAVRGVAVSGDGQRAVSASEDQRLKVWDLESGRELRTLAGHSEPVLGVALSADGRRAVSASEDKALKVWDLKGGEVLMLEGHAGAVHGVAVSAKRAACRVCLSGPHAEGVGLGKRPQSAPRKVMHESFSDQIAREPDCIDGQLRAPKAANFTGKAPL